MNRKITMDSFAFEDFALPVFVMDLSLAEEIFPSITWFSCRRKKARGKASRIVFKEPRKPMYESN
jgi:hypothetical protein